MSGLEALGVACSIFQVISFGREVVQVARSIYDGTSIDESLAERSVVLENAASYIQVVDMGDNPTKQERDMLKLSQKCQMITRDLREEINFILGESAKGDLKRTLKVTVKMLWRKRRLAGLQKDLSSMEKQMNSGLVTYFCSKTDIINIEVKDGNEQLRHFIKRYHEGHREVDELILKQSNMIMEHTAAAAERLKQHILTEAQKSKSEMERTLKSTVDASAVQMSTQMDALDLKKERESVHEKLLGSLKYAGMNQRRNDAKEAYPDTFQWVFLEGPYFPESDSSSESGRQMSEDIYFNPSLGDTECAPGSLPKDTFVEDPFAEDYFAEYEADETVHELLEWDDDDVSSDDECLEQHWDRFSDWLRSSEKMYWIAGKPGSGKTTLVKFILYDSRTLSLLESWKPNAVLISHFFWRPGTQMQQSIKGMLCALLHQLLQGDEQAQALILTKVPSLKEKDADTDWSQKELFMVTNQVISQYSKPICILLDGPDEIYPDDGVFQLLEVIEELSRHLNIKMCLSSRPEPLLKKALGAYSQLHIQDLTFSDLSLYAKENLGQRLKNAHIADKAAGEILFSIIWKSQGVFLWLCLAIKNVIRGVELGDDVSEIEQRIDSLPEGLADLYDDMFKRMTDDLPIYRQKAAHIFRLVMEFHRGGLPVYFSVFDLMLAYTSLSDQLLDENKPAVPANELLDQCKKIENDVNTRCAGLLYISGRRHSLSLSLSPPPPPRSDAYSVLAPYINGDRAAIRFIHRTAYDFLQDTLPGQQIIGHYDASSIEIRLQILKGILATGRVFEMPPTFFSGTEPPIVDNPLLNALFAIQKGTAHPTEDNNVELRARVRFQLVELCRAGNQQGLLLSREVKRTSGQCSDAEFLQFCVEADLLDYVNERISRNDVTQDALSLLLCSPLNNTMKSDALLNPPLFRILLENTDIVNVKHSMISTGNSIFDVNASPIGVCTQLLCLGGQMLLEWPEDQSYCRLFFLDYCARVEQLTRRGAPLGELSCYTLATPHTTSSRCKFHNVWFEFTQPLSVATSDPVYTAFIMLPVYTIISSTLKMALSYRPELESCPEVEAVSQVLKKYSAPIAQSFVVGITKHWGHQIPKEPVPDHRMTPYRCLEPEDDEKLMLALFKYVESGLAEGSSGILSTIMGDCYKRGHSGHGSLLKRLCDQGVTSLREYIDDNGAVVRKPPSPGPVDDVYPPVLQGRLEIDEEMIIDVEEHRECCKGWVDDILGGNSRSG